MVANLDAKVYAAKPFDLKVLKNDLGVYIASDDDIIEVRNENRILRNT